MRKLYLLMIAMMIGVCGQAQVTLPRATFSLDFEGANTVSDFKGTQVGDGELRQSSDPNFGTYYQNCPNAAVATKATNYLRVELGDGLKNAGLKTTDNSISIGFWVNPTIANTVYPDISYYWSVLYTIYTQNNRGLTPLDGWNGPMWSQNVRGWLQINDWSDRWDDFGDDENVTGSNVWDINWLAQKTESVTTIEGGNEVTVDVPTGFDDNWHYVVLVLSAADNNASFYVDGELFRQWNCKADFYASGTNTFFGNLGNYQDLYLGGVAQWTWADPDPAFAYDDFMIYAGKLDEAQQSVIMKIKRGEADKDTKLVIAQDNYNTALSEAYDYLGELETYPTLYVQLEAVLIDYEENIDTDPTIEKYNDAAATIRAKIDECEVIVEAAKSMIQTLNDEESFASTSSYPGASTYLSTLSSLKGQLSDVSSEETIFSVAAALATAKGIYVTSQALPADGSGIDATALILHPWFCNPDAEPTSNGNGTYTFPFEIDHSYAENTTPSDQNAGSWVNGNSFVVDDARVNWTEGRITWNCWHNKTTVGTLDIHQVLTGLPEGYYSVSADWITNADPTTQHTYATSGGVTKNSPYLDNQGWDSQIWTTLSTDKVYVGSDGTLTIGGASTTIGVPYAGWFCVTNFKLQYYGTSVDLTEDLSSKKSEVDAMISTLSLQGDITEANNQVNNIMALDDTYIAIDQMTALLNELKNVYDQEQTILDTYNNFSWYTLSDKLNKILTAAKVRIGQMIDAEGSTVAIADEVKALIANSKSYGDTALTANGWGITEVSELLNEQMQGIDQSITNKDISSAQYTAYQEALTNAMKSTMNQQEASESMPLDITFLLQNPSFTGDSAAGWTTETGTPGLAYEECEFYNTNFNIWQTLTNMAPGYYTFAVQGYYRDGSNADVYSKSQQTDEGGNPTPTNELNAIIYGNGQEQPVQSWAAFQIIGEEFNGYYSPNISDGVEADQVIYLANTMEAAHYLFDTKQLHRDGNSISFLVGSDGKLTVGMKKEVTINDDWTIFDNCHLYYIGQDVPTGISTIGKSSEVSKEYFTVGGARLLTPQRGINIVKVRHSDGSTSVKKILIK